MFAFPYELAVNTLRRLLLALCLPPRMPGSLGLFALAA